MLVTSSNINGLPNQPTGVGDLDFVADFADDGVDGGEYDKVCKVLEGEIALGPEYGSRNNFDKMCVSFGWA